MAGLIGVSLNEQQPIEVQQRVVGHQGVVAKSLDFVGQSRQFVGLMWGRARLGQFLFDPVESRKIHFGPRIVARILLGQMRDGLTQRL